LRAQHQSARSDHAFKKSTTAYVFNLDHEFTRNGNRRKYA
jgi:hypothetical protein